MSDPVKKSTGFQFEEIKQEESELVNGNFDEQGKLTNFNPSHILLVFEDEDEGDTAEAEA